MKKIFFTGNGNVAFHIKKALTTKGYILTSYLEDCDMIVISVSDSAYRKVIDNFPTNNKLMVHTSGSIPSTIFAGKTKNYGVIYPYQSLNKNDQSITFNDEVPLLITASNPIVENTLLQLAHQLSNTVQTITDNQRLRLHLAAVFANNFTNHMIAIAQKLAEENDLDTGLLQPLLEKTFLRLKNNPAADMQTGPAVRGDVKVIEKHLKLLENHPEWQKIYSFVSENITKRDEL